ALEKRSVNAQRLAKEPGTAKPELEQLTVGELDDQIDKIREVSTEMPVKSKFKLGVAKIEGSTQDLECPKEVAACWQRCVGKVKAVDEYMTNDEEKPQDEEMYFTKDSAKNVGEINPGGSVTA
ncbi:hypothetical protein FRC09_013519, partial [Ceratobasidium sp. 395]